MKFHSSLTQILKLAFVVRMHIKQASSIRLTTKYHSSIILFACPYEQEVTEAIRPELKRLFPALLDLGRYNMQLTNTAAYGPTRD
jgi:hypothetical protein